MSDILLVDSGVWFAMFDPRDQYHSQADRKADLIEMLRVVVPWPTTYETLRTRFVKNRIALARFERFLKSHPDVQFVDDSVYRDRAFEFTFHSALNENRSISMVDWTLRLMILDDREGRFSYLATFNPNDFRDVCELRGVELV